MADTSKCFALVRGHALRATKLDGCGNPVLGPDSVVVSEGFIQIAYTANSDAGTAISITNAAGKVCISDTPAPKFLNYTIEIQLCGVNPDLVHLFTGNPIVYDAQTTPQGIGFDVNSDVDLDSSGFALETWSGVPSDACEPGVSAQYGYGITPFIKGGILGDFAYANDAVNFTVSGAQSKDGAQWGVGPFDVINDASGVPGPLLTPLSNKNHLRLILTSVAPPTDVCGAQALGVEATGATAGIPATLTPTNSYAPANLAALVADPITATPSTAWTTGQYLLLRDGSKAHWNATTWVAGPA